MALVCPKLWLVALLVAMLFVVAACGSASVEGDAGILSADESSADMSDEADPDHGDDHDHGEASPSRLREWTGSPAPEVLLTLDDDPDGALLTIEAAGFTFTPASVTEPVQGEGHAHLYVDGALLTMVYRPMFVLPQLPDGDHEIIVTLSTNDHLEYSLDGQPIGASITILASGTDTGSSGIDDPDAASGSELPAPPVVPETALIETIQGVVISVNGDLTRTVSFILLVENGDEIEFFPTTTATFHGGPMSHIRDHLASGVPVIVEYAVLDDETHAAISASDQ